MKVDLSTRDDSLLALCFVLACFSFYLSFVSACRKKENYMTIGGVYEFHEYVQTLSLNQTLKLFKESLKNHNYAMTNELLMLKPELQSEPFGQSKITPLYMMLAYNPECDETIFRQLMQLPRSINAQNGKGRAVIHLVSEFNRADLLSILLERDDVDINLKTAEGGTALAIAAQYGYHNIITILAKKGANLRETEGPSAIHFACGAAKFSSVQALIQCDSSLISYRDPLGRTPAHYLASSKSTDKEAIGKIIKLFSNEQLALECKAHATPAETARYFKNYFTAEAIKGRQLLSLYQLCQVQLCKEPIDNFHRKISAFPDISIKEVLIYKKSRM